jgi:hypothetical protein
MCKKYNNKNIYWKIPNMILLTLYIIAKTLLNGINVTLISLSHRHSAIRFP